MPVRLLVPAPKKLYLYMAQCVVDKPQLSALVAPIHYYSSIGDGAHFGPLESQANTLHQVCILVRFCFIITDISLVFHWDSYEYVYSVMRLTVN